MMRQDIHGSKSSLFFLLLAAIFLASILLGALILGGEESLGLKVANNDPPPSETYLHQWQLSPVLDNDVDMMATNNQEGHTQRMVKATSTRNEAQDLIATAAESLRSSRHMRQQEDERQLSLIARIMDTFALAQFETYVTAAGLHEDLQDAAAAPFTVFAPWDNAFLSLDAALVDKLQDKAWELHLHNLLEYHIHEGNVTRDDIAIPDGQDLLMKNGETAAVKRVPVTSKRVRVNTDVLVLATYNATDGYVLLYCCVVVC